MLGVSIVSMLRTALALFVLCAVASAQDTPVFRTGTRLVQVDVVVRDKNGPILGLTKDDFKLYVCDHEALAPRDPFGVHTACRGKLEPIQIFHAPGERPAPQNPPAAIPT